MGYYSVINAFDFVSQLSPDALKKAQEEYAKKVDEGKRCFFEDDFYAFERISDENNGFYHYELCMPDYSTKNYADAELAKFISRVIAPGSYAVIELVGEDSLRWGYLVLPNEVYELDYVKKVEGVDLQEFVHSRFNKGGNKDASDPK